MLKIVFENPDRKPKHELARKYTKIISAGISTLKCPFHNKLPEFKLYFNPPNYYSIKVTACCQELRSKAEDRISLMLS